MAGDSTRAGERWRDIPGWVDLYRVSDWGRVRSLDRVVVNRKGHQKRVRGRVLKPGVDGGYHLINLCRDGEQKTHKVHHLVLEAFVGPPEPGQECRHLDGNPSNNRLENLAWGSSSENGADMVRHGTSLQGAKHHRARLTEADVLAIRAMAGDYSHSALGRMFSVSSSHIGHIINGRNWAHLDGAVDD